MELEGDTIQVLGSGIGVENIVHRSNDCAALLTVVAETTLTAPVSISAARDAAILRHCCATSVSLCVSRLSSKRCASMARSCSDSFNAASSIAKFDIWHSVSRDSSKTRCRLFLGSSCNFNCYRHTRSWWSKIAASMWASGLDACARMAALQNALVQSIFI